MNFLIMIALGLLVGGFLAGSKFIISHENNCGCEHDFSD